jgi:lysine decarboxylase
LISVSEDHAALVDAWLAYHRRPPAAPFTIPGHKGRAAALWPELGEILDGDVPMYGGLDTVKKATAAVAAAEAKAAALWGADWCRFSVGGSTHANQTLALAIGAPGDQVLVTRAAHRSTLLGLVLAGLDPVWLPSPVDRRFEVPLGVTASVLGEALATNPRAKAVFLVEPSYLGTISDLPALVEIAHAAGVPVLVDQAWAAHFGFHPSLPRHALALGADALVTSAHKTLPAYSQASLVLARTDRLSPHRLERAFEAGHTTSPAGSIMASIDGARALLARRGAELLGPAIELIAIARERLRAIGGVLAPGPEDFPPDRFDPMKLVVVLPGSGADGIAVEQDIIAGGVPVEMADRDTVVPIATLADDAASVARMVEVLRAAIERHRGVPRPLRAAVQWGAAAKAAMIPRDAFFARHETVSRADAIGRICAEVVAPYPPGVPVLIPGEVVTDEIMAALADARDAGTRIAYAADPALRTLQVVYQPSV